VRRRLALVLAPSIVGAAGCAAVLGLPDPAVKEGDGSASEAGHDAVDDGVGADAACGPTASIGCPVDTLFCESFEAPQLPSQWESHFSAADPPALARPPCSASAFGSHALHVGADAGDGGSASSYLQRGLRLEDGGDLPPGTTLGVRAYVFVAAPLASSGPTLLLVQGPGPAENAGLQASSSGMFVFVHTFADAGTVLAAPSALPLNRWVCVQWQITPKNTTLVVDERSLGNESMPPTAFSQGLRFFDIGLIGFDGAQGASVYFDEVAVAMTVPPACR